LLRIVSVDLITPKGETGPLNSAGDGNKRLEGATSLTANLGAKWDIQKKKKKKLLTEQIAKASQETTRASCVVAAKGRAVAVTSGGSAHASVLWLHLRLLRSSSLKLLPLTEPDLRIPPPSASPRVIPALA
jgi:hypothetical protein